MNSREFIKAAIRTDTTAETVLSRLDAGALRLLHGAVGLATEAGEMADAVKKHVFYGKPIDRVNVIEEAGDLLWYLALIAESQGFTFEEAMARNQAKLRARYPEGFTEAAALNRDHELERLVLGGGE